MNHIDMESVFHKQETISPIEVDQDLLTLIAAAATPDDFKRYFKYLSMFNKEKLTPQQIFNVTMIETSTLSQQQHFFSFRSMEDPLKKIVRNNLLWEITKKTSFLGGKPPRFSGFIFIGRTQDDSHNNAAFPGTIGKPHVLIVDEDPLQAIANALEQESKTKTLLLQFTLAPNNQNITTRRLAISLYNLIVPDTLKEKFILDPDPPLFAHWEPEGITFYNEQTQKDY